MRPPFSRGPSHDVRSELRNILQDRIAKRICAASVRRRRHCSTPRARLVRRPGVHPLIKTSAGIFALPQSRLLLNKHVDAITGCYRH